MEEQNTETEIVDNTTEERKNGILNKIKSTVGKAATAVKSTAVKAVDSVKTAYDKHEQKQELLKYFNKKATAFSYDKKGKYELIYGIRNIDEQTILFLANDRDNIRSGMELHINTQILIVKEFDVTALLPYTLDNYEISLDCFKATYKLKENQIIQNNVTQTNNITVGDNFQGDINAVNQAKLDSLEKIEKEIKRFKPGLFHKRELTEANDMFVSFKSQIVNNEKPESSFLDKFLKVLQVVAPAAITLVTALL